MCWRLWTVQKPREKDNFNLPELLHYNGIKRGGSFSGFSWTRDPKHMAKESFDSELLFIFKRIQKHIKSRFPEEKDSKLIELYLEGARLALELVSLIKYLN